MKHDKVLLLLSSTVPLVAVLGFVQPSSLRSSQRFYYGSLPGDVSSRHFMFNGNPLDMVSSFFSQPSSTADTAQSVNAALATLTLPDWKKVRLTLESNLITDEERNFRSNLSKGYGVASPLHKIRLFDASNDEKDIRVTFYRDSASKCQETIVPCYVSCCIRKS